MNDLVDFSVYLAFHYCLMLACTNELWLYETFHRQIATLHFEKVAHFHKLFLVITLFRFKLFFSNNHSCLLSKYYDGILRLSLSMKKNCTSLK